MATKKKTTTATTPKKENLKRLYEWLLEVQQLIEDMESLWTSLKEQLFVLCDLFRDAWNIGVQIVAVLLKIVPIVDKGVGLVKRLRFK